MLRVYIKPPGEDWVEYTPIVRADREFEIGGRAFNMEADQGTITIDDPDLSLDEVIEFGGHREVKITTDASGSEKVLALGRIGPKSMERGQHPLGRELTLTVEDVNSEGRGIIVDKWGRPEETGRARVLALRAAYLHGSLSTHARARDSTNIDVDDFFPDANNATMPAKFYEGTDPQSIIRECAEFEGKLTFLYPQDNGDKELFYAVPNDLTLNNCTLEVSDDPADVDQDTVFEPWWNAGPALNSDPLETITGLSLIHPDGQRTYDNDASAEDTFDKWEESMFTELAPGALADAQLATIIAARNHEEKRRQFSLRLPESKVHLIKQGMLLHVIKADAANIPNVTGGSQKYRIAQIRYRWLGPDATDDNQFLVIVTLEVNIKLKLRYGRHGQAQRPPPTPRPAPPCEPDPSDTLLKFYNADDAGGDDALWTGLLTNQGGSGDGAAGTDYYNFKSTSPNEYQTSWAASAGTSYRIEGYVANDNAGSLRFNFSSAAAGTAGHLIGAQVIEAHTVATVPAAAWTFFAAGPFVAPTGTTSIALSRTGSISFDEVAIYEVADAVDNDPFCVLPGSSGPGAGDSPYLSRSDHGHTAYALVSHDHPESSFRNARKTSDQTSTSTSFANVTDLTFSVSANTNYKFRFVVFVLTSGASEGYNLSVNGPSGTYKMGGIIPVAGANSAGQAANHAQGAVADTSGLSAASGGTGAWMALVEGVALIGASGGTLALRVKAETGGANSVTIQANSTGEISEIT